MTTTKAEYIATTHTPYKSRVCGRMSTERPDSKQAGTPRGLDLRRASKNRKRASVDDDTETVLDLKVPSVPYDDTGKRTYERACKKYGVIPSSLFLRKLSEKDIDLTNYGLGPKGVMAVSVALVVNSSVTSLILRGNCIDSAGVLCIQQMMTENMSITDLDLSENNLGTYGAKVMGLMLRENKVIRYLNLSGNQFTDPDAIYLTKAIQDHSSLEHVDLSHNEFGDLSGPDFEKMISDANRALLALDLSWNQFRLIGAKHLAIGLKENAYLKYMNVSWNGLDDDGGKDFGEAISNNNIIEVLDISCCRIGPEGFAGILKGLKNNETLQELRIGKNNIPEEAAEAAIEMFDQMESVTLIVLDMTDVILGPRFQERVDELKEKHENLEIKFGYSDMYGKRKMAGSVDVGEDALLTIKEYMERHNLTISELFARFDDDGSNSVDYDEFREGIKEAKIDLTDYQVDKLIQFIDIDGDGDLDFSEVVLKMKEVTKKRQAEDEQRKEEAKNKRKY
ncbi:leucine-rich repeat-containing protein 74A-like [Ylistrum balloti]|uniref:leucine-rich repeat-containing protein 74A-like n=1 Tax=Ylistrum balloti TaxID=509963 RepID=UPI002905F110|nr:leucine-rich repeat-containing protein 74A-like [Ylistrum balloti]